MSIFNDVTLESSIGGSRGELIPIGSKVTAVISEFGWLETSTGGKRINIKTDIVEGEYAGKAVYDSINLLCTSKTAKSIALQQFRSLCASVGNEALFDEVYSVASEDELDLLMENKVPVALVDRIIEITVGVERGTNGYQARNKIKTYAQKSVPSFHQPPINDSSNIVRPGWMK